MEIKRDEYLQKLIARKNNGLIKVITGIRRCGKSYLLFTLFKNYLLGAGVKPENIIGLELDDIKNKRYRDPEELYNYVVSRVNSDSTCYVLLDEVQYVSGFEDVLNGFLHIKNVDVYVTGSNSKFLSSDIITEFRGRGDEVRVRPLTFSEFYAARGGDKRAALNGYMRYGGLPIIAQMNDDEQKAQYLTEIFDKIYISDIKERYNIRDDGVMEDLLNIISSSVGSLTNPTKLANTFKTVKRANVADTTIKKYLDWLTDAFLIERAVRYDVKGKKYIETPSKYYFADVGLRNARLNFRQQENTHLMENIVYNELRARGFSVDVGVVTVNAVKDRVKVRNQLEVDFVADKGDRRFYIQSAFAMPDAEKYEQEQTPLLKTGDSFKKIIVVGGDVYPSYNESGIFCVGLCDFLLNKEYLQ